MKSWRIYLALPLVVLFTLVVVQNTEVISLRFLAWEFSMSRIILLVLTLVVGFLLGYLWANASRLKRKVADAVS